MPLSNSRRTLAIPGDVIPSGTSFELIEPTFRDRVDTISLTKKDKNKPSGYDVDQIFVSMCLKSINGTPINSEATRRDPVAILSDLSIEDVQALVVIFVNAFVISEADGIQIRKLARAIRDKKEALNFGVSAEDMPNGKAWVTHKPNTREHAMIIRRYDDSEGYNQEEFAFSCCLTSIDGAEVIRPESPIELLLDWSLLDVQFALGVFHSVINLNDQHYDSAIELGKQFRRGAEKELSPVARLPQVPSKLTQVQAV